MPSIDDLLKEHMVTAPAPRIDKVYYCEYDPALFRGYEIEIGGFLNALWPNLGTRYLKSIFKKRFGLDPDYGKKDKE